MVSLCVYAGSSGYTPLHYAARAGQVKAVQLLLKHGGCGCLLARVWSCACAVSALGRVSAVGCGRVPCVPLCALAIVCDA